MAAAKVAAAVQLPHVGVAEPPNPSGIIPSTLPELPSVEEARANIAALKKKYLEERDKRLNARPEGNAQYKEFKGIFEKYLKDPYVERVEREPINEEVDFVVLGGGYGGQCIAAELIRAGITNIRLIEKAGDFGGTWYWNRYPGAACDVESYIYMPLLEETGYIPTEKYAKAPELQEHARRIGRHFGLYERSIFQTEAREIEWDDNASRWIIKTDRGDTFRARFFASASGPLNMPKLPGVEGIENYKGHYFHTSRWDYDYTGGTILGKLDKIKDKKIAIIGTGATAIQAVPHLGEGAKHLYVFQRTPSSVGWRNNRKTDPEWVKSLKPGWQAERQENFLKIMAADPTATEDMVDDGWTAITKVMRQKGVDVPEGTPIFAAFARAMEQADYDTMESIRKRCDEVIQDQKTAHGLKPWYRQLCKRPCFHDEYLNTFNRPNVTLVHTDGKGIDRITETGIVANGQEFEVDCIVYSTGFEVGTGYERRSNFSMKGRDGVTITDSWADGPRTLHGFHCPGFPNMFLISTLQSGFASNFTHMLIRQGQWVAAIVKACMDKGINTIEANKDAAEDWTNIIVQDQWMSATFQQECTPGYYNLEGQIQQNIITKRAGMYAKGPLLFCKVLDAWVADGDLKGLDLTYQEKTGDAAQAHL